jgi:uncharacterized membrane protein YidH (DUF202 family)
MEAREPEHLDETVESLLRSARTRPEPEFVMALRERLFRERTLFGWVRRPRPALVAALGAASVAIAVTVLSLAGAGPLAGRSGQDVKAKSNCHFVLVKARGRVPVVVHSRDGQARIVYRDEPVERPVERCG